MTARISVTPDKDGIIRITCGGADLELDVSGKGSAPTSTSGPAPEDPIYQPILSLVGKSWNIPDVVSSPSSGQLLTVEAHVVDVHGVHALVNKLSQVARQPGSMAVHVDLRH